MIVWLHQVDLRLEDTRLTTPRPTATTRALIAEDTDSLQITESKERLRAALDVTYWSRLWIVQEIILAKERYVLWQNADTLLPWPYMRAVYDRFKVDPKRGYIHNRRIRYLLQDGSDITPTSLEDAIRIFSHQDCKDPCNKIYALQGLIREQDRLEIDYNKPVHAVFADVIRPMHVAYVLEAGSASRGRNMMDRLTALAVKMGISGGPELDDQHRSHGYYPGLPRLLVHLFDQESNGSFNLASDCIDRRRPAKLGYSEVKPISFLDHYTMKSRWWVKIGGRKVFYQ